MTLYLERSAPSAVDSDRVLPTKRFFFARALVVLLAAATATGCGSTAADDARTAGTSSSGWPAHPSPEPGFDPDDPALSTMPESDASRQVLLRRVGNRRDFKVPARWSRVWRTARSVLAVVARPFDRVRGRRARSAAAQPQSSERCTPSTWRTSRSSTAASRSSGPTPPGRSPAIWCSPRNLVGSREFADIFRDAADVVARRPDPSRPGAARTAPREHAGRQACRAR